MMKNLSTEITHLKTSKEKYSIFNSTFKENLYYTNKLTISNIEINDKSIIGYIKNNIKNATCCLLLNIKIFNEQNSVLSGLLFLLLIILSLVGFVFFIPIMLLLILSLIVQKFSRQVISRSIKLKKKIQPKYNSYKKKFTGSGKKDLKLLDYFLGFPVYLLNGVLVVFFQGSLVSFSFFKKMMEKVQKGTLALNNFKDFLFINSSKLFQKNANNKKGKLITDGLKKENLNLKAQQLNKTKIQKNDLSNLNQHKQLQLKKKEVNKEQDKKLKSNQQQKAIDVSREKERAKMIEKTKEGIEKPVMLSTPFKEVFRPKEVGENIKLDNTKINENVNKTTLEANTLSPSVNKTNNINDFFKSNITNAVPNTNLHNIGNPLFDITKQFVNGVNNSITNSITNSIVNGIVNGINNSNLNNGYNPGFSNNSNSGPSNNPNMNSNDIKNMSLGQQEQFLQKQLTQIEQFTGYDVTGDRINGATGQKAAYNPALVTAIEKATGLDINNQQDGLEKQLKNMNPQERAGALTKVAEITKTLQIENQRVQYNQNSNNNPPPRPARQQASNNITLG